jgi:hypothetical protein
MVLIMLNGVLWWLMMLMVVSSGCGQEFKNGVVSTIAILYNHTCMQSTQYLAMAQKLKGIRTDKSAVLE